MTAREFGMRIINIITIAVFIITSAGRDFFRQAGFYIGIVYILFLILKPYMQRHPASQKANFPLELVDIAFAIAIGFFMEETALMPLVLLALLRSALVFSLGQILLLYGVGLAAMVVMTATNSHTSLTELFIQLIITALPCILVCLVKGDILSVYQKNKKLEEKLQLKNAVINELQKYSDSAVSSSDLEEIGRTDYVTQVPNRAYFEETLTRGLARYKEPGFNLALLLVTIEGLYEYRLKYGYAAEHLLVKRLCGIIGETLKRNDFVARYEEDIIGVLLFNKDIENAVETAQHLKQAFLNLKQSEPELRGIQLNMRVNDLEKVAHKKSLSIDRVELINRCQTV